MLVSLSGDVDTRFLQIRAIYLEGENYVKVESPIVPLIFRKSAYPCIHLLLVYSIIIIIIRGFSFFRLDTKADTSSKKIRIRVFAFLYVSRVSQNRLKGRCFYWYPTEAPIEN